MSSPAANVRHKLSVSDFYRMGNAGILHEDSRVELIAGELIDMSPIGSHHAGITGRLNRLLQRAVNDQAIVYVQNPVRLSDWSEPQPDIMILKSRPDDYYDSHPGPADVLLLIEVADSSIDYDRKTKLPLYAQHGIPEYWIINLNEKLLERHTQPDNGQYRQVERFDASQMVATAAFPDITINLADLFA